MATTQTGDRTMRIVIDEYLTCDLMDAPTYNAKGKYTGMAQGYDVDNTIEITDAEWDAIGTGWVKSGGHKKWLADAKGGKFHYVEVKPFAQYLHQLIELARIK